MTSVMLWPSLLALFLISHTYATEMLRVGVGFPVLTKLLGHTSPEMTMRYLDVALTDLQQEFQLARSKPSPSWSSRRWRSPVFEAG